MIFKNLYQMITTSILKHNKNNILNHHKYNELYHVSRKYVNILKNHHQIPICVAANKTIDWIALMYATWETDNIFVPMPIHNKTLTNHIIKQIKPIFIFGNDPLISQQNYTSGWRMNNTRLNNETNPALILYTSGSTKEPKGVVLSHQNILSNLDMIQDRYKDNINEYDCSFSLLPWHHCYGLVCELLYIMKQGGSIKIPTSDIPINMFKEMKWNSPTLFFGVPKILENLYKKDIIYIPNSIKKRLIFGNRIRMISVGGSLCNPKIIEFMEKTYDTTVYQGYGTTECSPIISLNSIEQNKIGSVGKVLKDINIRFSEDGVLSVKGDNVMLGYLKSISHENDIHNQLELEKTNEWYDTGDHGYLDEEDYLYITGRNNVKYKLTNGKYVDPQYIETLLGISPIIEQVVVFGEGLDSNIVVIYSKSDKEMVEKEVYLRLKDKIELYEIPKKIIILNTPFENGWLTGKMEPNRRIISQYFLE